MSIQEDINSQEGKYSHLTYEKLKSIIEDVVYNHEWKHYKDTYEDSRVLVDAPEGWEENRRKELLIEIPPGCYEFNSPNCNLMTGQGGAIDMQIAMEKSAKGYK